MDQSIAYPNTDWSGLLLRLTIALVMLPHGAQKMLGIFGGYGFKATMNFFTESMKLPWPIAFLVIIIEFVGPISLLLGFGTRLWATALAIVMIGAVWTTSGQYGFFMNWYGNQAGEGFEYHLLVIGLCLSLLISGGGQYSIDRLF